MRTFSSLLLILSLATSLALGQPDSRGDSGGTHSHPVAPILTAPKAAWETEPRYRDSGAMVLLGKVLVTGNINGRGGIFGYDAETGKQLWSLPGHLRGDPASDGAAAYAVSAQESYQFRLHKIDPRSGKVLWSKQEEDLGHPDGHLVVAGGAVVLVNRRGGLLALDAGTGKDLWRHDRARVCSGVLTAEGGTVYFSGGLDESRNLTALDARTGATKWSVDLRDEYGRGCTGASTAAGGRVFARVGPFLYAVDAASGATSWKQRARETIDGRERDASLSELAVYEGVIYAATSTGIQGWETAGGKPVFAFPATRQQGGSQPRVAIAKGVLYFQGNSELPLAEGRGAGWLYALDLKSRQLLWKYHAARPHTYDKTGSWPTLHILPADGALFYETEKRLVKLVP